ncbi:helix-turn-helix domain-containing protein [Shewanella surugensis]|uniref:Helix-turn-helix domain-containing protein n=1 Tax=Shewanella surugensis TaxID=212020 RepID=A0ABT0LJR3_9GAMM|nr:helix-turn-helix domain-containing protein [Shewanella surugensis]
MRIRLLTIAHFQDGLSRTQIANILKISRTSVNRWVSDFLSHGVHALQEKHRSGRPSKLSATQQ